tara:strand:- start:1892 stop:2461 length:570 start_codon:yes stop_codon:yes gene_type:complete
MSGPFGSSQWFASSAAAAGPAFDNWGGTMRSVTRGTYANGTGVYNLTSPGTVSHSTTGGGMYVIGMHQKVRRWIGIANGTSIQGQNASMSSEGGIFRWTETGAVNYRFKGTSQTTSTQTYSTAIPYAILDMTGDSGYSNQIRLYGGDDTLILTFNYNSNTTWNVYTCSFDSLTCAWDLEPIGQSNYSFS